MVGELEGRNGGRAWHAFDDPGGKTITTKMAVREWVFPAGTGYKPGGATSMIFTRMCVLKV